MKRGPLYVDGTLVLPSVRGALRWWQRLRGLLFAEALPADGSDALLIRPCSSIHTIGMRYELDVVFIDKLGRVLSIHPRIPPWRACMQAGARDALELRGGVVEQIGLKVGDTVEWRA